MCTTVNAHGHTSTCRWAVNAGDVAAACAQTHSLCSEHSLIAAVGAARDRTPCHPVPAPAQISELTNHGPQTLSGFVYVPCDALSLAAHVQDQLPISVHLRQQHKPVQDRGACKVMPRLRAERQRDSS